MGPRDSRNFFGLAKRVRPVMTSEVWTAAQLVSTLIGGMIAVLAIAYDFSLENGRITLPGWIAVIAAVFTTAISVLGIWRGAKVAQAEAARLAAERAEEIETYARLLATSTRAITEVRLGLRPIEEWTIRIVVSVPLWPESGKLHDNLRKTRQRPRPGSSGLARKQGVWLCQADVNAALDASGHTAAALPRRQFGKINVAAAFFETNSSVGPRFGPWSIFDALEGNDPEDQSIHYDFHTRKFLLPEAILPLKDCLWGNSQVRSIFDLPGKTLAFVGIQGDDHIRIERIDILYGSILLLQRFTWQTLVTIPFDGKTAQGIVYPPRIVEQHIGTGSAKVEAQDVLAWIRENAAPNSERDKLK
jgi:hypothetical protein